jgi:hypothetical protein
MLAAEREIWNWHQNYFDEDNCNAEDLHLKDAFEAIGLSTECLEEHGHNQGWSLGHYDEFREDPDAGPFGGMLDIIKQTYQVGPRTYKVRINAIVLRNLDTDLHYSPPADTTPSLSTSTTASLPLSTSLALATRSRHTGSPLAAPLPRKISQSFSMDRT